MPLVLTRVNKHLTHNIAFMTVAIMTIHFRQCCKRLRLTLYSKHLVVCIRIEMLICYKCNCSIHLILTEEFFVCSIISAAVELSLGAAGGSTDRKV